jgi:hypothetical protein
MNERDLGEEPALHRTGETDAHGKKCVRKEILFTEQMVKDIAAVARIKNMGEGEYMRRCVERDLYGELELMRRSVREITD